jgi:hypothetical protein
MRVSASFGTELNRSGPHPAIGGPREPCEAQKASLPAVVPAVDDRRADDVRQRIRPAATLIAQLVATAEDLPSARARRRADPRASAERYRAVEELRAAPARITAQSI